MSQALPSEGAMPLPPSEIEAPNAPDVADEPVSEKDRIQQTGEGELLSSEVVFIKLSDVQAPPSTLREMHDTDSLEVSLAKNGMLQPILVRRNPDYNENDPDGPERPYVVVFGRHRVQAARNLSWQSVPATVKAEMSDTDATLAEIDENLERRGLSEIERIKHLKLRQKLYNKKFGVRRGRRKAGEVAPERFDESAAKLTGLSPWQIRQDVAHAEHISDEVAEMLTGSVIADNRTELKRLAEVGKKNLVRQHQIAELIKKGEANSVAEAEYKLYGKVATGAKPRYKLAETPPEQAARLIDEVREVSRNVVNLMDGIDIKKTWPRSTIVYMMDLARGVQEDIRETLKFIDAAIEKAHD